MDKLHQQVARARRRLVMEQFFSIATRTLLVTVVLAAIAVVVPKIWSLGFTARQMQIWYAAWLGSGLLLGLVVSLVWTLLVRRSQLEAAIEIDHRFGLKERVSSALALSADDIETPAGQALLSDAVRRANRLEINEKFRLRATPWFVLPPALWGMALLAAFLLPNALPKDVEADEQVASAQQVKKAYEDLQKEIQQQRERAEAAGLEDAKDLLAEIEVRTEEISAAEETDRREAQIELNNLRKEIERRRDELGDGQELQQQMRDLDELGDGPARDLAEAMKQGDFNQAEEELKALEQMLGEGNLSAEQTEALASQMNQMAKKLEEAVAAHEGAKAELDEQIAQAEAAGDKQRAEQLREQREQLAQRDSQMSRMQNMAQSLSQCSQCMQQGDGQGAADQLAQLSDQMGELADQAAEMELMEGALDQISDARDAMNCQQCQGAGCQQCQGGGQGNGQGQGAGSQLSQNPGDGMGAGRGNGDRPEGESATATFDSQVQSRIGAGRAAITGDADGPNLPGVSQAAIQEAYEAAEGDDSDPLVGQVVPRSDQKFVQEYYDALRRGELGSESVDSLD